MHIPQFYLYKMWDAFRPCFPRQRSDHEKMMRNTIFRRRPEWQQNAGASLFLWQQLEHHPSRTTKISEADLFVVPPVLDLAAARACLGDHLNLRRTQQLLIHELEKSPYFQRNQGRDHLLIFHSGIVKNKLFVRPEWPEDPRQLRNTTAKMIYAFRTCYAV
eukprot:scaffold19218_cov53-Prasinocladus_malaysianus.AAC.1